MELTNVRKMFRPLVSFPWASATCRWRRSSEPRRRERSRWWMKSSRCSSGQNSQLATESSTIRWIFVFVFVALIVIVIVCCVCISFSSGQNGQGGAVFLLCLVPIFFKIRFLWRTYFLCFLMIYQTQVCAPSLPVVVIVHGNQEPHA